MYRYLDAANGSPRRRRDLERLELLGLAVRSHASAVSMRLVIPGAAVRSGHADRESRGPRTRLRRARDALQRPRGAAELAHRSHGRSRSTTRPTPRPTSSTSTCTTRTALVRTRTAVGRERRHPGLSDVQLQAAVRLEVGKSYTVSYLDRDGLYAENHRGFLTGGRFGMFEFPADAGVYKYGGGTRPTRGTRRATTCRRLAKQSRTRTRLVRELRRGCGAAGGACAARRLP